MAKTKINKTQAGDGIWTADNLVAGTDISITQVPQPVIDDNTVALFHFDGNTNNEINNNYTVDSSLQQFEFDSIDYKFGGSSAYVPTNKYSKIISNTTGITRDFTIDFWARHTTYTSAGIVLSVNGYDMCTVYPYYSTNTARIHINSSMGGSATVDTTKFNHFAVVLRDSRPYFFINGKLVFFKDSPYSSPTDELNLRVVSDSNPMFIDELRVSNIARWTEDFTPFTVPYMADAGPAQYQINNTKADPDLSSYLQNTATGSYSLTICGTATTKTSALNIGKGAIASQNSALAIGHGAEASGVGSMCIGAGSDAGTSPGYSTAIGTESSAHTTGTAVGAYATARQLHSIALGGATGSSSNIKTEASAEDAIAIGYNAKATAQSAIQLGTGTNSTASTFQVFNTTVVDANGKIPAANLDTAIPDVSSYLQNTATGSNSLTIGGTATTGDSSVNIGILTKTSNFGKEVAIGYNVTSNGSGSTGIGVNTQATGTSSIAIGSWYNNEQTTANGSAAIAIGQRTSSSGQASISIGQKAQASAKSAVAIGGGTSLGAAQATAQSAIQLGTGTNSTANTFQVFNTTVVDASGKVPLATLPIVQLTQAEYDALATKDANTLYLISEA